MRDEGVEGGEKRKEGEMGGQSYLNNFLGLILHFFVKQVKGKGKEAVGEGTEGGGWEEKEAGRVGNQYCLKPETTKPYGLRLCRSRVPSFTIIYRTIMTPFS